MEISTWRPKKAIFEGVWPGPFGDEATLSELAQYLDSATDYVDKRLASGEPMSALAEKCHPLQIELRAVKDAHAAILNGGFCQFLFNSSGALSEEAARGFLDFGLIEISQLFDQVLSHFARPISKERPKRINMLFEQFDKEKTVFLDQGQVDNRGWISPNIFEMSAPFFDPFDKRFYQIMKKSGDGLGRLGFHVPICNFMNDHREIFFRLR